ncbi:DUF4178 domain-containing protein [Inhella gelatinilytica]|uniref:DUF4178 domain-containing protein n=1 Tax=Inhella gelatinilytica TaxID=2795030 RepID=A0A931J035_9BURK|nr:DUF4178 domain-containing protein [Inhella gelatinilytica]MBH9554190.1 DUF4178 domain-containing protein [Inhella gelatinilytica]
MAEDQTPAQRRWRAACPNCGAPVEFASAASGSAVCGFCRSTLAREGEVLRKTGESAELFSDYSPLQIGTQGKFQNEPFTILGRVQLAYEGGRWTEWHAFFDNSGKSAWLSEDNGSFVLSWPLPLAQPPAWSALVLGAQQLIDGQGFRVAALTPATLHAAEGELPQAPRLGEAVQVAELRSNRDEVGSLEYGADQAPRWSLGQAVDLATLQLVNTREESSASWAGRSLQCPSCGAPIQPALQQSQSITCGQCSAVIELAGTPGADLQFHAQAMGMEPPIPLGRTGRLSLAPDTAKLPWQVVGFMERCTTPDEDGEQYFWREYLLFNQQQGFAFLVDATEGWSLARVLTGAPDLVMNSARWQGKTYSLHERYGAITTHVLGEFYWKVQRDERCEVADYRGTGGAKGTLSREQSGHEVTWSLGRPLDAREVASAFGLNAEQQARIRPDGTPAGIGDAVKGLAVFAVVALLLVVLFKACSADECDDFKTRFGETSAEYQQCRANQRAGSSYRSGSGSGGWSGGGFGGGHK